MEKNKKVLIGCALFFLAVLIGEAYCLLNFEGDYITIAGVGAVLLIAAYLLMDAAFVYRKSEKESQDTTASMDSLFGQPDWIEKKKAEQEESEAEKIQKGMYVIQKRLLGIMEEESAARQEQDERLMEFLNSELAELIKAEIKYERENTKQVIANNKKKLEQVSSVLTQMGHDRERELRDIRDTIQDMKVEKASVEVMLKEYQVSVDKVQQQLTTVTDLLRHVDNCTAELARRPAQVYSEPVRTTVMPTIQPVAVQEAEPIMTDSVAPVPEAMPVMEPELEAFMPAVEMEPEEEDLFGSLMPEFEEEPVIEAEPEEMSADFPDISALLPEESETEEFEMPELSAMLDEAEEEAEADFPDISALLQEEETEPEPTPIPTLAPAAADSNKMLSPDEIAALFASTSTPEPEPMGEIVVEAEPIPEPVPIPEPAPAPAPAADSNKMMSPDEIAALIASMGQ